MIGKLLLIRESGLLPFSIKQDDIEIDESLLSGFCTANYNFSKELNDSIDILFMKEKYKIIFEEFIHSSGEQFLMALICDKYMITEGIKQKMEFIFNKLFRDYEFVDSLQVQDEELEIDVKDILNDIPLKNLISDNLDLIIGTIGPILDKNGNDIYAFALTSSTNNILYFNGNNEILKYRKEEEANLKKILEGYLNLWNIKTIPQADIFSGLDLVAGLDPFDFNYSDKKLFGLGINTSINLKEEPKNEILLYIFGKSTLMRQSIGPTIEETLRSRFKL
ncbi:MAG: hypothetical protein ACTSWY_02870 [Promethearchaeota archaeon]